jgi:hypothetical protein
MERRKKITGRVMFFFLWYASRSANPDAPIPATVATPAKKLASSSKPEGDLLLLYIDWYTGRHGLLINLDHNGVST